MADTTFTGIRRRRTTRRSVRFAEISARTWITLGGVGTILAVLLICGFLIWIVADLFAAPEVERVAPLGFAVRSPEEPVIAAGADEAQSMAWTLRADGRLVVRQISDGTLLQDRRLFGDARPTSWAFSPDGPGCAFGFADGTLRRGRIEFETEYPPATEVSAEARKLRPGGAVRHERGMISVTPRNQHRYDFLTTDIAEPVKVAEGSIDLLDYSLTPGGTAYSFYSSDGQLVISSIHERHNMMTDTIEYDVVKKPLVYDPPVGRGPPAFLKLSGIGNTLYFVWRDGYCLRFDARSSVLAAGGDLEVVEEIELLGKDRTRSVERVAMLVGKTTMIVGDSAGTVTAWFPTRPAGAYARDGIVTAAGHVLPSEATDAPVTAIQPSRRTRLMTVAHADGTVRLIQVTTEQELVSVALDKRVPVTGLALAPKEDGILAWSKDGMQRWRVDPAHPEATVASLFLPTWYEGDVEPMHQWQAEGGSDDFEPKFGLMKLVYGTIKATLYSMLIAAPIALLAAIFTSEFLTPRARAPVKSVIEMMASLPSVVLGFLAAIVLAPFVENVLITVLCTLITLPLTVVLGARLWQFLPTRVAIRLGGMPRFLAITLTLPLSVVLAQVIAPHIERLCFSGDVQEWLIGNRGDAAGGWTFILIPICIALAAFLLARFLGPWLRAVSIPWSRLQCAGIDLVRFAVVIVGGIGLAWVLGEVVGAATDPRGSVVGKYEPRNAMIVGFVMGFAIVPIIYTLAEDALSSVPSQLREGSLGCGATPWQTALRIVVPTAMSGLFSALMIGLGRAVGETMIVLMAAGNTAIFDLNPFNGFRTLSANIATEMPEAAKGGTHYRILFLAGLVLFAMTFVINTMAEIVRRRFRKRFADL